MSEKWPPKGSTDTITDVPGGIKVGHYTDSKRGTGCTVLITPHGALANAHIGGGAPGTREFGFLSHGVFSNRINAILLTGGSAFGLGAANGCMEWLQKQHHGATVGPSLVPIVPSAVLFDLFVGDNTAYPTANDAFRACETAHDGPVELGSVGAGTGATVGKLGGIKGSMMGGIGSASIELPGNIFVGALVAVNPLGDIVDPQTGKITAGAFRNNEDGTYSFTSCRDLLLKHAQDITPLTANLQNTTLAIIATNAQFNKEELKFLSKTAHDGIARVINPAHTQYDGDIVFSISTGTKQADVSAIGTVATETLTRAILKAINRATDVCGIKSRTSLQDAIT